MLSKLNFVASVLLTVTLFLAACAPAASAATPAAPGITPTAPAPRTAAAPMFVGLVTPGGGVDDQAFNRLAWQGMQKAAGDLGLSVKFVESSRPEDYEHNMDTLAAAGARVIITVGAEMGESTALKARQYPDIQFAIIDHGYVPSRDSVSCGDSVKDCYADGGLSNVTSLMFAEEQSGFLAGVLAGGMSDSGFVCSVSSLRTPASDRYVKSFHAGAVWQAGSEMKVMNHYINIQTTDNNVPSFADSSGGKQTALKLIGNGCDVLFAVGGGAVNGVLLAAKENNLPAIGADVDQYSTAPEVKDALISSAQKKVDVAVYNYLKSVADGSVKAGITSATLQNGGVGLAPFHDWENKIPDDLKTRIQKAADEIINGSIKPDQP